MSDQNVGIDFDEWVSSNNPVSSSHYSKAFWSWIETVRRLSTLLGPRRGDNPSDTAYKSSGVKLGADKNRVDLQVVGTIQYDTPPPEESISMPVVRFETANFCAYMAHWFSVEPFLPSYVVAVDKRRIPDDHEYDLFDILFFETLQNEATDTRYTNEQHTLDLFERMKDRVICDQQALSTLPFCLDPQKTLYGDPDEKTVLSFDELHSALSEGDTSFLAQKPLLFSVWSYEGLYSALSTLHRVSGRIR